MTDRSAFADLVTLVGRLRAQDGCPWDRAQDHYSLRPYVLEEAHEVIAAIDTGDPSSLADELGDLLLQVLLHSQIASEADQFSIDDVIDILTRKLIRRHPHVFADAPKELQSIHRTWETIKRKEGHREQRLPTLLAARKLAASIDAKMISESDYPSDEAREGGLLLLEIARIWNNGIDPEIALQKAIAYLGGSDEAE